MLSMFTNRKIRRATLAAAEAHAEVWRACHGAGPFSFALRQAQAIRDGLEHKRDHYRRAHIARAATR
jgi:Flp pilus assembly protein CpaB